MAGIFAIAAFAATYTLSCTQEAEPQQQQPTTDVPVTERTCSSGYCELSITATSNATVELCGDIDITPTTGSCDLGCNPSTDEDYVANLTTGIPFSICVLSSGSVCIRNPSSASQSVTLDVKFSGTSIPLNVTLSPGQVRCFHTNSNCSETNTGCQ